MTHRRIPRGIVVRTDGSVQPHAFPPPPPPTCQHIKLNAELNLVCSNTQWEHLVVHLTRNVAVVVTCMMSTRRLASGNPLAAVFKTYHDAPVSVVLPNSSHRSQKVRVIAWFASSTMEDLLRQQSLRWMQILSIQWSHTCRRPTQEHWNKRGLMPDAFHELLKVLLNAPSGVHQN